ncbi:MAG: acyltransferase family protein [Lachnospiraceae bacterium]|nr:acyltransferase family protein [Lachnospiraceae bacterium]
MRERVTWLDVAKGVGMLLVIVGHTVGGNIRGEMTRGIIYSFHMPLFFILGCITMRFSSTQEELLTRSLKQIKKIIIPTMFAYLFNVILSCIVFNEDAVSIAFFRDVIFMILFSSAGPLLYAGMQVPGCGVLWFMFVFVLGRIMMDILQLKIKDKWIQFIVVLLLCFSGMALGEKSWACLSMDVTLGTLPLFWFGYLWKDKLNNKFSLKILLISGLVFIVSLYFTFPNLEQRTYMEVGIRNYGVFPISYFSAVAGVVVLSEISMLISNNKIFTWPLQLIGKYSMYLFFIHFFDQYWEFVWRVEGRQFVTSIRRIIADLFVLILVVGVKKVKDNCIIKHRKLLF